MNNCFSCFNWLSKVWRQKAAPGVGLAFVFLLASVPAFGQLTFAVNSLGDDGQEAASSGLFCFTGNIVPPQVPECTLRAAIESANDADEPVNIIFSQSIPTTNGNSQIGIETGLPFIQNQVTIDGSTHPNYQGNGNVPLRIRYTGPSSSTVSGIRFSSNGGGSGSTVNAIGIVSFTGSGILLNGGSGYMISNNAIGIVWLGGGPTPAAESVVMALMSMVLPAPVLR